MEAVLTDLLSRWLQGGYARGLQAPDGSRREPLAILDQASVSSARQQIRDLASAIAMPASALDPLLLVATELTQNQLAHAGRGWLLINTIERQDTSGIELVAADRGPGMLAPADALRGKTQAPNGLGAGLGAVLRLAEEVDIDTRVGEGTCIWARKFNAPVSKQRQVAIYARHHPHELSSGDDAWFLRTEDTLMLAVADGLGHGPDARLAATRAVACLAETRLDTPDAILQHSHAALRSTRGAVMAVVHLPLSAGSTEVQGRAASVGNVSVRVVGPGVATRVGGSSFTLGTPSPLSRVRGETLHLRSWDALIAFTDGISSRAELADTDLLLDHPMFAAQALMDRHAVAHDDALILVAR